MSRIEKPYVLLVDDNEPTRTLLTALLRREFQVEWARDGYDAIEQLKTRTFAVILLDLRMPHLDGFGVLDYLKQDAPEKVRKVVIITAALTTREVERARTYDVYAVVPKPFDVDAVLNIVRTCSGLDGGKLSGVLCSSGPVILLLADLLRQRLM